MRVLGSLANFVLGALVGALAGAIVASMLAPHSGPEMKMQVRQRIDEGRAARERAEAQTAAEMQARFRQKVKDPNAFSGS